MRPGKTSKSLMEYKLEQPLTEKEWHTMSQEDEDWLSANNMWYCQGFKKIMSDDDFDDEGDYEYSMSWQSDMEALNNFDLMWYAWQNMGCAAIDEVINEAHIEVSRMSRKEWNEWVDSMSKQNIDFTLTKMILN